MRWSNVIDLIKGIGFTGDGEDLSAVKSYLENEGHSTEVIYGEGDTPYKLDDLFKNRKGKILDASEAERQSKFQDMVDAQVEKQLQRFQATVNPDGRGNRFRDEETKHLHVTDVKVGHDRLAEDPKGGFQHSGEFFKSVFHASGERGVVSKSLDAWNKAATTYSNEGTGVDGGFAVPTEYRSQIESHYGGEDSILSRTDQIQMSSNSISLPDDEDTPWNPTGIQAEWEGEAGTQTQRKVALKAKQMRASKLVCLAPVTEELLEDSSALASYLPRKAGEVIDFKIGEAIFRGTGAGQPLGFLNHSSTISVSKVGSQDADTIVAQNVIDMYSRLYGRWRKGAVWMVSQSTEPQLFTMSLPGKDATGTSVGSIWGTAPIYLPAGSLAGSPYATLLGLPIITTEHCEEVGDAGDIVLCAFSKYRTALRGGLQTAQSMHVWFDQDVTAFKFRVRMDGMPAISGPVSARDGSQTYSAFVKLAARG